MSKRRQRLDRQLLDRQLQRYNSVRDSNVAAGFNDKEYPRIHKPLDVRSLRGFNNDYRHLLNCLDEEESIFRIRGAYRAFDKWAKYREKKGKGMSRSENGGRIWKQVFGEGEN